MAYFNPYTTGWYFIPYSYRQQITRGPNWSLLNWKHIFLQNTSPYKKKPRPSNAWRAEPSSKTSSSIWNQGLCKLVFVGTNTCKLGQSTNPPVTYPFPRNRRGPLWSGLMKTPLAISPPVSAPSRDTPPRRCEASRRSSRHSTWNLDLILPREVGIYLEDHPS